MQGPIAGVAHHAVTHGANKRTGARADTFRQCFQQLRQQSGTGGFAIGSCNPGNGHCPRGLTIKSTGNIGNIFGKIFNGNHRDFDTGTINQTLNQLFYLLIFFNQHCNRTLLNRLGYVDSTICINTFYSNKQISRLYLTTIQTNALNRHCRTIIHTGKICDQSL